MSVSSRSAGSATTMLLVGPLVSTPAVASAPGSAGMYPPFATIAPRLQTAPIATIAIPGSARLRSTAARTATFERT